MPSKLLGCIGFLYKVVHKTGRFSVFIFTFFFSLVLKFGTLPLSGLFSNTLLAIFGSLFCSRVIHRFVPKNGPKCGCVSQHNFISKANLKNPEQDFLVHRFHLLRKQKRMSLARLIFNLKAIKFGAFFAYFHFFRHLRGRRQLPAFCFKRTMFV